MNVVPSLPLSKTHSPIFERSSCTETRVYQFSYTWTIKNFSYCREGMGEKLKSPAFYFGDNDNIKGSLTLYPDGDCDENSDYLSLHLKIVTCKEPKSPVIRACTECSFLTDKKIKFDIHGGPRIVTFFPNKNKNVQKFNRFIERKYLLAEGKDLLMPDDILTILCEGRAATEIFNDAKESQSIPSKIPDCHVVKELGSFFENEKFSDVTLVISGEECKAHKVILAAQSPVFAAMFNHDMVEQQQNRVDITDMEYKVFREMLCFIYTGEAPNLKSMVNGLLSAADKYSLLRLKVMCEEAIAVSFTTNNVAEILALADLHSADQLKSEAMQFVITNAVNVIKTRSFELITRTHPHLSAEVFSALALIKNDGSRDSPMDSSSKQTT